MQNLKTVNQLLYIYYLLWIICAFLYIYQKITNKFYASYKQVFLKSSAAVLKKKNYRN